MPRTTFAKARKLAERLSEISQIRKSAPGQIAIKLLCDQLTKQAVQESKRRGRKRQNRAANTGRFLSR